MRFAGVDVASQTHVVAVITAASEILVKPTSFAEDAAGYERLFSLLDPPIDILPAPTPSIDDDTDQLREITHLFARFTQDLGDRPIGAWYGSCKRSAPSPDVSGTPC